ncbi:hypothetical protein KSS87_012445 [Heliosperma pusillum]|nr:hypothetical protein KSS87_012445 [Heliosperma pusillum]
MSLYLLVLQLLLALRLAVSSNIALPNCSEVCGQVKIPYPFGIGDNCYYEKSYEITCNNSFFPAKPFLRKFNVEVLDINWPGMYSILDPRYDTEDATDLRLTVGLISPNLCQSDGTKQVSNDFRDSPFLYSRWYNVFVVEGCGGSIVLKNRSGNILTGCASFCDSNAGQKNTSSCYGVGCCQASLLSSPTRDYIEKGEDGDLDFYKLSVELQQPATTNACSISATLIESKSVNKFAGKLSGLPTLPTVLEWRGIYIQSNNHKNFTCYNESNTGPQCFCEFPYEGNPFLPYGCQVLEVCRKCKHRCGIIDNPNGSGRVVGCEKNQLLRRASVIGFSSGMGLVLLVLGGYWLYRYLKRRKMLKQKANNFKRNGGLLLQQQMSSNEGTVERTKVFTVSELEKATDNFNENRILGQGGQGTVYKGMLMDGRIVAIKKSKKVDESQVEPFINEVVILSQINHRNVVALLGCCLETEVPTLVYEFIPNGTLYEHIQGAGDDFHINWKMRLQIAAESAGAVAYLHSSSSTPIYHRDIKSTNILLDEKYRAKVSDFGTSRAINIEQTHVTTAVQGTYGYLDPEYFQSNQFTEKSDVYSFGVVLVELLTGKKPICPVGNGGWISLAVEFLSKMEDSRLFDILDSRILDEGKEDEFIAVAELARKCLNMNGKQRPTMKEIAVQLDAIRSSQMPSSKQVKPNESNHAVTEMIHFHSGPISRSTFSIDDDSPASTIEVQPLMALRLAVRVNVALPNCSDHCGKVKNPYPLLWVHTHHLIILTPSLAFMTRTVVRNAIAVSLMKETHFFLMAVKDRKISEEGKEDEFMAVAELARKCLNMNRKQRPTMKEIAVQLDVIRSSQMPISKDVKAKESNFAITELIRFHSIPLSRHMFTVLFEYLIESEGL